jgi:hypothetical protein
MLIGHLSAASVNNFHYFSAAKGDFLALFDFYGFVAGRAVNGAVFLGYYRNIRFLFNLDLSSIAMVNYTTVLNDLSSPLSRSVSERVAVLVYALKQFREGQA